MFSGLDDFGVPAPDRAVLAAIAMRRRVGSGVCTYRDIDSDNDNVALLCRKLRKLFRVGSDDSGSKVDASARRSWVDSVGESSTTVLRSVLRVFRENLVDAVLQQQLAALVVHPHVATYLVGCDDDPAAPVSPAEQRLRTDVLRAAANLGPVVELGSIAHPEALARVARVIDSIPETTAPMVPVDCIIVKQELGLVLHRKTNDPVGALRVVPVAEEGRGPLWLREREHCPIQ